MQAYTPSQPPTLPKRNKFWPSDFWEIRANFYRTLQIFKIQCDESTCELISLFQSISLALKKIAFLRDSVNVYCGWYRQKAKMTPKKIRF